SDLRIDILSEFGLYASQAVVSKGRLTVYWAGDHRYFKGDATREEMVHYLQLPLDPDMAIRLLASCLPLETEENYTLKENRGGREIVLRGKFGEIAVAVLDGGYIPLHYTGFGENGSRDFVVTYAQGEQAGEKWFPKALTARFWKPSSRLEIRFRDVE